MKISARNTLKGIVKSITIGTVNPEVVLEIAPDLEIVCVITKTSVESLGLTVGAEAYGIVKSTDIMIGID